MTWTPSRIAVIASLGTLTILAASIVFGTPPPPREALATAPPPPIAVADSFSAHSLGTFRPLEVGEYRLVQVTVDDAVATVLANLPDVRGPNDDAIQWRKGGCEFLGWYEGRPMSFAPNPPPPIPVYLVQLFGDPVPGWPGPKEAVVMVNATTGERGSALSGSNILGTTCGAVP
jgi:hypothetical protein